MLIGQQPGLPVPSPFCFITFSLHARLVISQGGCMHVLEARLRANMHHADICVLSACARESVCVTKEL